MKKAVFIAIIVLIAAPVIFAQPMEMGRMGDKLRLSDQQIEQMQNLKMQNAKDMIKPQGDLKLAKIELKELLMKSKVDEKAVLNKVDQISSIKSDIAKIRMQHLLAARNILNDEQLAQWRKMRHGMGRGMKGRRGCDGPCGMMGDGMMGGPMGLGPMMGDGPCKMGSGMPRMMEKEVRIEHKDQEQEKEPGK
jgi:Spy/CpxP family protein refolding chaperone